MRAAWRPSCAISTAPRQALIDPPLVISVERDKITVEAALWWNDSYHENVLCFTNNIPQRDGGTPSGRLPRRADPHGQQLCGDRRHRKKEKVSLTGDDAREGLTCVLSVKVPDPKFSSQTKDKLVSSEVRPVVESVINEGSGPVVRRASGRGQAHRRQDGRGGGRARSGAQGARADPAQGRA